MIAVDRSQRGKGLGSDLAVDALGRARSVAGEVGLKLVVLDVIDDGGGEVFARRMEFYRRLGFQSFEDRPERMFIAIDTIRDMFSYEAGSCSALRDVRRSSLSTSRVLRSA